MTVQPGSSVYDPGSGGISTAPGISANDLLGGSVTDFVKSLGPNYSSFSFTSGNTGVNTTNSAQNIVDAQNYANLLQAQTQQHIADLGAQSDWLHTWTDYITNLWKLQHPTGQAAA